MFRVLGICLPDLHDLVVSFDAEAQEVPTILRSFMPAYTNL